MNWLRFSNPLSREVGFSWPSPGGRRTLVASGAHPQTGLPVWFVGVDGSPFNVILPVAELDAEVARDTARHESRQAQRPEILAGKSVV